LRFRHQSLKISKPAAQAKQAKDGLKVFKLEAQPKDGLRILDFEA
jgi:hypothetical protein